jgi:hypothetical protein
MHIFHGGCHGCTRQQDEPEGVEYCVRCQYFDADWSLPDLSNEPLSPTEELKLKIQQKHGMNKVTRLFKRKQMLDIEKTLKEERKENKEKSNIKDAVSLIITEFDPGEVIKELLLHVKNKGA